MSIAEELGNIDSGKTSLRNFGLAVGAVLAALGCLLAWKERAAYPYFLGLGAALIALGVVRPVLLKPVQRVWMGLAVILGFVMTRIILLAVFFLVVTPVAVLARAVGKDFLSRRLRPEQPSYWILRDDAQDPRSCEKQY